ncbi:MAG: YggT family protein [Clostridia bacterium]|nr:YggT family protein [Clostridia bacterium]
MLRYLVNTACSLYELIVFAYCVLSWLRIADNQWTTIIKQLVEPLLTPIRRFLDSVLPASLRMIDLSPWALMLLVSILRRILLNLFSF